LAPRLARALFVPLLTYFVPLWRGRLLIDDVTVEADNVQIRGSRKALERAVVAPAACGGTKVPSFAWEWRAR